MRYLNKNMELQITKLLAAVHPFVRWQNFVDWFSQSISSFMIKFEVNKKKLLHISISLHLYLIGTQPTIYCWFSFSHAKQKFQKNIVRL